MEKLRQGPMLHLGVKGLDDGGGGGGDDDDSLQTMLYQSTVVCVVS
jgi:hypothetical protein